MDAVLAWRIITVMNFPNAKKKTDDVTVKTVMKEMERNVSVRYGLIYKVIYFDIMLYK